MAKFLTASELNLALENLIKEAELDLVLISPYIKLHDRLKDELKKKKDLHKLRICIVFGKNEDDVSRSMGTADLDFFMSFPNVEIYYEKNLHAKYYANEFRGLITSMNLHQFSQNSNIEVGVLYDHKNEIERLTGSLVSTLTKNQDIGDKMWNYFNEIIDNGEEVYIKTPEYESKLLGIAKKYIGSKELVNNIADFFGTKRSNYGSSNSFVKDQPLKSNYKSNSAKELDHGYCIRCELEISLNIGIPYCNKCFSTWQQFQNPFYEEKVCHGCKNPHPTTMEKPLCYSCYKKFI
jgi:PLD-like domain